MLAKCARIASHLKSHNKIKIVSHIDADGIASASIASIALSRANIEHSIEFVKQLDKDTIERLKSEGHELIWFTDLGSGVREYLEELNFIITDHHKPSMRKLKGNSLIAFYSPKDEFELNPHFFQFDGSTAISGAGLAYLIAKSMSSENLDLAPLAIVGAVGDLQDSAYSKLVGLNREIVEEAKELNLIDSFVDIRYFGRETRPVFKLLEYASDPLIPTLSGREENCIQLLLELGIELKAQEQWRRWIDLNKDECQKIISELVFLLLSKGFGASAAKRIIGEVYVLKKEPLGTELHDAKEFATLLNACGRYGYEEIGYRVCLGDRAEYFERAKALLREHRKTLVESLHFVNAAGVVRRESVQYFHALNNIGEKVVGIVAGMVLSSGSIAQDLPLLAFAQTDDGKAIKVSARATRELVAKGLDLASALGKASSAVGGIGGGHAIAAGATIPKGSEEEFLNEVERVIKEQLLS
ncbi:MAG: DHH family phosphoesterase [Candidatus Thermoplasmatota archaeon]